jgi:hypothetical protein
MCEWPECSDCAAYFDCPEVGNPSDACFAPLDEIDLPAKLIDVATNRRLAGKEE